MANKTPTTVNDEQAAATVETPKRETNGKVSNPRYIVWPFDQHGFTTLLRKEGARAIGRIKGSPEKLEVFIETLKVLGQHAQAKVGQQEKAKAQTVAAADNRAKAAEARSIQDQEREVARLEALVKSAKDTLAARKGGA